MPKIIVIEKTGTLREINLKTYTEEELYKKAGFKSSDGFEYQTQWKVDLEGGVGKKTVCLYAKTRGRAGQENKYDFPPPVDTQLYFNSCVLVNIENGMPGDLTMEEWETIYEHLFGGFEDIGSKDSELSSDESDEIDTEKTKNGYYKDGFVVDSSDSLDELVVSRQHKKGSLKQKGGKKQEEEQGEKPQKKQRKKTVFEKIGSEIEDSETESNMVNCTQELEEEEYLHN